MYSGCAKCGRGEIDYATHISDPVRPLPFGMDPKWDMRSPKASARPLLADFEYVLIWSIPDWNNLDHPYLCDPYLLV